MGGEEEYDSRSGVMRKGWALGVSVGLTSFTGEMVCTASVQSGVTLFLPEQLV